MRPNDPSIEARYKRACERAEQVANEYDDLAAKYRRMKWLWLFMAAAYFALLFIGD